TRIAQGGSAKQAAISCTIRARGAELRRVPGAPRRRAGSRATRALRPLRRLLAHLRAARRAARRGRGAGDDRPIDRRRADVGGGCARRAWLARLVPQIYHPGAAPLCEPESAALDRLFQRRFDRAISFHSFGGWIFWPWANRRETTADDARFGELAAAMRER